jgi:ABC-type transport system involved in multi-copper enzyme maturation permease subunit
LGKYLAVMVSISMPLFVGITMNLFIIITSGALFIDTSGWVKICAMIGISLIYISAFVLLSLFISSSFRESSTALVVLLLLWMMSVVIVPSSGGIIASKIHKPASLEQWRGRLQAKLASAPKILSTYWSYSEPLTPAIGFADARESVLNEYRQALVNQAQWTRNLMCISPTANYQYAAEAIAGTGLTRYETFLKQVKQYKMELLEFTRTEHAKNQRNPDIHYAVDYNAIPKFTDKLSSLSETAQSIMLNLLLLFLFNIAFFIAAFVSFLRYDVR